MSDEIDDNIELTEIDEKERCDVSWVKEYNFKKLPNNFAILVASPRRAGKTHLMKHLLSIIKDRFDACYLFSKTADLQCNVYDYVPINNVYNEYNEEVVSGILKKQEEMAIKVKQDFSHLDDEKRESKYRHVLIIMDDVIGDGKLKKYNNNLISNIFTRGRHAKISIICLSQTISTRYGFPAPVRTNCDIGISFLIDNQYCRESYAESYMSMESKKKGIILFNSVVCSDEYTAVICDKSIQNRRCYKDYVFKIKAPKKLPKYMIGKEDIMLKKKYVTNIDRPEKGSNGDDRGFRF